MASPAFSGFSLASGHRAVWAFEYYARTIEVYQTRNEQRAKFLLNYGLISEILRVIKFVDVTLRTPLEAGVRHQRAPGHQPHLAAGAQWGAVDEKAPLRRPYADGIAGGGVSAPGPGC